MSNCRVCNIELTESNWMPSLVKKNSIICRDCNNTKGREWRNNNREKSNKYQLERYFKDPKKSIAITNKSRRKVRIDTINAYGGKCVHCGISDIDVLDIDHIDNDGAKERKENLFAYNLYRKLKKEGFPKERYQVLCKNCNWKKELNRRRNG